MAPVVRAEELATHPERTYVVGIGDPFPPVPPGAPARGVLVDLGRWLSSLFRGKK